MKKRYVFLLILSLTILLNSYGQPVLQSLEFDPNRMYDPQRVGGFSGAMKSCFYKNKNSNYLQAHQATLNIMNRMTPIERNESMGEYQYVLRTRTLNGRSLSSAECERLIKSDWQSYVSEQIGGVQN